MPRLTKNLKSVILRNFSEAYIQKTKAKELNEKLKVAATHAYKKLWEIINGTKHDKYYKKLETALGPIRKLASEVPHALHVNTSTTNNIAAKQLGFEPDDAATHNLSIFTNAINGHYHVSRIHYHFSFPLKEYVIPLGHWEEIRKYKQDSSFTSSSEVAQLQTIYNKYLKEAVNYSKAMDEVKTALNSVTTVKKLLNIWPECEELIPDIEPKKAQVPSIPVAALNAKFGLPSEPKS